MRECESYILTSSSGGTRGFTAGEGGGGNQIGAWRRLGECAGVDTPPAGGGPGTSPEQFWKLDANFGRILVDFSSKIVGNFCLQSSDILDAG